MTLTVQEFANGDTDYVSKLNNNFGNTKVAVEALQAITEAAIAESLSPGSAFVGMFGAAGCTLLGDGSYLPSGASTTLTVAAGYAWIASLQTVVSKINSTALSFSGQAAATYYVVLDASGVPSRSASSTNSIYSVEWTGSAFGAIAQTASQYWTAAEMLSAMTSTALAASYDTLDERLEAGEELAVDGSLSYTYNVGQLSKSVAGDADVTLTTVETNNSVLRFTGVLTGDIDVLVPLTTAPRVWLLRNDTTGSFTLTLKGSAGAGELVQQGAVVWAFHDGTNVVVLEVVLGGDVGSAAALDVDTDVTLAADSDTLIATQKAVKAYVTAQVGGISAGDVDGPASAVADRVVLFDGTTGKLIKDSGLTLSGTNTGDQTSVTGNAATATALETARTIGGVSFDGTANISQPFDMHAFYPGAPAASAKVLRSPVARAVGFVANFAGSYGVAGTAATASTVFDIQKNGVSIGSATFAAAGTVATFASASGAAQTLAAGDVLSIIAPASADATLADAGFALAGTR